jgi:hypothetical protein
MLINASLGAIMKNMESIEDIDSIESIKNDDHIDDVKSVKKMKIMIDGVFYSKEILDFEKILKNIADMLGNDVIVRSLEFPEIGAVVGDTYYYRCGFTLDKELKECNSIPSRAELDEIKNKIAKLFPNNTIIYSLNCEIYE